MPIGKSQLAVIHVAKSQLRMEDETRPGRGRAEAGQSRYPELLGAIRDAVAEALAAQGIPSAQATAAAARAAECVREHFGGGMVYVPKGDRDRVRCRDAEIRRRAAAGETPRALRREFGISQTTLRRALKPGPHQKS